MRYWEESLPEGCWRGHGPPSRTAQLITSQLNSTNELSVHHSERIGEERLGCPRMVAVQDILQRAEARV
jgi:hypothetical protein